MISFNITVTNLCTISNPHLILLLHMYYCHTHTHARTHAHTHTPTPPSLSLIFSSFSLFLFNLPNLLSFRLTITNTAIFFFLVGGGRGQLSFGLYNSNSFITHVFFIIIVNFSCTFCTCYCVCHLSTGTCFIQKIYAPSSSLLQGKHLSFPPPHCTSIFFAYL